jgi:cytoskeletal protein RodZ
MDSEHDEGANSAREIPVAGAGMQLRAAREALRLDLAHVAAETRIPLRHLQAIEQGNFESLPSRAYAIGFSRTFAKAVGLDAAAITDVVRSELADGSMRRSAPSSGMEPGDPARLPSAGLAWAGAFAALVLAVGAFAFFNSYFGAGTEPGSLTPAPEATPAPAAQPDPAAIVSGPGAEVVLTAQEEVWVRIYEDGGERLLEKELAKGERFVVPPDATAPLINTARPDLLAISVAGKSVAKLSDRPAPLSGAPISAGALLARAASATGVAAGPGNALAAPAERRAAPRTTARVPAAAVETVPEAAPAPATDAVASTDVGENTRN